MQRLIEESGLYFDPPNDRYFRWDKRPYSVDLCKRFGVHEMDFAWWDPAEQVMNLLELKDCSRKDESPRAYVDEFVQKATDCLLLLGSVWHALPHAKGIKSDLHEEWHERPSRPGSLRFFFVVKLATDAQRADMPSMRDKLKTKLRGRLELFALREIAMVELLDHVTAEKFGIPVRPIEAKEEPPRGGGGGGGRRRR